MNSLQIEKVLKSDLHAKKLFLGVFARDELPTKLKYPSFFILNTHSRSQPGEHWLAIFYDKIGRAEFFDSYGQSPEFYGLKKYLDTTSTNWTYNKKCLQSFFSNYCGLYCLFYLYQKSKGISLFEILNNFENKNKNDFLINKFIQKF